MYLNPLSFLARFFVKRLVSLLNVPGVFKTIAPAGFTVLATLVRTVGIFPVLRCLIVFNKFLKNSLAKLPVGSLTERLIAISLLEELLRSANINPLVSRSFIDFIRPHFKEFVDFRPIIIKWMWWFFTAVTFTAARKFIFYGIKSCLGLLLGSVGVLLNESLSAIPFLKESAIYFVEGFEKLTDFKVLKSQTAEVINPNNFEGEFEGYNWFNIAGLAMIGVVASVLLLCVADYYAYDTVKDLPVLGNLVNSMHGVWDSITNWYHNWANGATAPDGADPMSRSNSTGSYNTARPGDHSPVTAPSSPRAPHSPPTPPTTPPLPEQPSGFDVVNAKEFSNRPMSPPLDDVFDNPFA